MISVSCVSQLFPEIMKSLLTSQEENVCDGEDKKTSLFTKPVVADVIHLVLIWHLVVQHKLLEQQLYVCGLTGSGQYIRRGLCHVKHYFVQVGNLYQIHTQRTAGPRLRRKAPELHEIHWVLWLTERDRERQRDRDTERENQTLTPLSTGNLSSYTSRTFLSLLNATAKQKRRTYIIIIIIIIILIVLITSIIL